jgi:hypothetical protein
LLPNDREISNYTSLFPRQQLDAAVRVTMFLCGPYPDVISRTILRVN